MCIRDSNFVGQQEIDNFSVTEKKTLAGLIRSVSETIIPNDLQKRYASRLFSALQVQEANLADPVILLSNVDSTNHKRHMLFCCLEYLFLENEALDLERVDQHFVGSFDFSARIWNELKSRIDSKYKLLGIDGFVGNLPLESDIADEFEVMLEFDAVEEACEPAPRTEHEILNMLIIVEGEKIVFENADIFLGSFINCTGTLVLRNCSIDYGKSMTQGRILLEEGATLEVDGSEILGFPSEDPEHSFITCKGKNKITIRNSKLIDLSLIHI